MTITPFIKSYKQAYTLGDLREFLSDAERLGLNDTEPLDEDVPLSLTILRSYAVTDDRLLIELRDARYLNYSEESPE